jgi:hypothetical protein
MKDILLRIRNILLRPGEEWKVIKEEETTPRTMLAGYLAVIAVVPPAAAVLERVFLGGSVAGRQPVGYVITTNILWYLVIILNMVITAAVFTAIFTPRERWLSPAGLKLTYSFTPVFLVSALLLAPRMVWLLYVAILYSVYLLYLGVRSLTDVAPGKAALSAFGSFIAAALIIGLLNGLEYMLESFVMSKVFFEL